MDMFSLLQHITTPMHVSGHNLIISPSLNDLNIIISSEVEIIYYISNHCFAECQLSIPGPNILVKELSHHKFKQIDMVNFRSDTTSSVLCNYNNNNNNNN